MQLELKGLVPANPLIASSDVKLSRKTDRDGYHAVYRVRDGKKTKLGSVGNAAGLRWLLAMSGK